MKYIIATHGYLADGYVSSIQVLTKKNNIYAVNAYVDDRDAALRLKTIIESFESGGNYHFHRSHVWKHDAGGSSLSGQI